VIGPRLRGRSGHRWPPRPHRRFRRARPSRGRKEGRAPPPLAPSTSSGTIKCLSGLGRSAVDQHEVLIRPHGRPTATLTQEPENARAPLMFLRGEIGAPTGHVGLPAGRTAPRTVGFRFCRWPPTIPIDPEPQSLFVVFVPLPPVSEMLLSRPWPPVFQGPHDDLHDGHREQDDPRDQHKLQHVRHCLGMDRVATLAKDSRTRIDSKLGTASIRGGEDVARPRSPSHRA
jgi:hypothetical protein